MKVTADTHCLQCGGVTPVSVTDIEYGTPSKCDSCGEWIELSPEQSVKALASIVDKLAQLVAHNHKKIKDAGL